jgi:hypothetical protein
MYLSLPVRIPARRLLLKRGTSDVWAKLLVLLFPCLRMNEKWVSVLALHYSYSHSAKLTGKNLIET